VELLTEPFDTSTIEWATLPLRLVLGAIFVHSGYGKLRGPTGFGNWLAELGYPMPRPTARGVATLEFFGGLALLAGLFTHWVAIPLAANMVVATYTNAVKLHLPFSGNENAQGYELDILMVGALVALVLGGAGPLSLDQLLTDAFVD
jgi:putative oxidoreductase